MYYKRKIHPTKIGGAVKSHGFAAVLEVAFAMNYAKFLEERLVHKVEQTRQAKQFILKGVEKHNSLFADNIAQGFEVARGLGVIVNSSPFYIPKRFDFSVILTGMDRYRFERAYENAMASTNAVQEQDVIDFGNMLLKISGDANIPKIIMGAEEEKRVASGLLRMPKKQFNETLKCLTGRVGESYFSLFLEDYFKAIPSLIIPRLAYTKNAPDKKTGRFRVIEKEIDFIISCDREKFYDTLRVISSTKNAIVTIKD